METTLLQLVNKWISFVEKLFKTLKRPRVIKFRDYISKKTDIFGRCFNYMLRFAIMVVFVVGFQTIIKAKKVFTIETINNVYFTETYKLIIFTSVNTDETNNSNIRVAAIQSNTNAITETNTDEITAPSTLAVINTPPAIPDPPITGPVTQPTCDQANGSFTITNYDASYTYTTTPSTDVIIIGANVTAPEGSYIITATNVDGSTDSAVPVVINPQPETPVFGSLNVDCTGANLNSVTVNATISSGTLEYNVDGGTYQSSNIFTGLSVGDHTFNIRETSSQCSVSSGSQTIECICPTVTSNTINASQTICEGETPTGLTGNLPIITPVTPFTYQWQSRPAGTGVWTNLTTTQNYSPGALTASTDYRRLVKIAGCTDDISNISTITVNPKPVFGSLNVDCTGANLNSVTVNATISSGTLEYNVDGGTYQSSNIFTGLSVGDHTFNIRETSSQCSVSSGSQTIECICPTVTSNTINASQTICEGETPTGLTGNLPIITPVTPFTYQWQSRPAGTGVWTNLTTTQNYSPGALTASTDYRRLVKIAGCTDDISNISTITVNPKPVFGSLNVDCTGANLNSVTVNATISSGTLEYNVDGGTYQSSNIFTGLSVGDHTFNIRETSSQCSVSSGSQTIECICPTVTSNTINASQTICEGETPTGLTGNLPIITPVTPFTYQWQSRPAGTGVWTNLTTTQNYSPGALTASTDYGRLVKIAGCTDDISNISTITVNPKPVFGSLNVDCTGANLNSVTVNATISSGTLEYNVDGGTYQSSNIFTGLSVGDHTFNIRETSSQCSVSSGSQTIECICPTVTSNTINASQTICEGETPTGLTGNLPIITPVTPFTYQWQSRPAGTGVWTNLTTTQNYSPGALTASTDYRRLVKIAGCTDDISNISTITVNPKPVFGSLNVDCTGANLNSVTVNATISSGTLEYNVDGGTYQSSNIFTGLSVGDHTFNIRETSSQCSVSSGSQTIECICPTVTSNTINASQTICEGETPTGLTGNLPIITPVTPFTYQWQSRPAGTGVWTNLTTTQNYSPGALTASTDYRRLVKIAGCTDDISNISTITVNPKPVFGSLNVDCTGANLNSVTVNATISSGTLEYNVDGGTYQSSNIFTGLSVGDHTFNIRETSSQCSVSSGSQTIECICPTVTSNTINASQTICEGETPTGLTGNLPIITPVTPFTYQWQSRPAGTGVWTNLTTTQNYSPGALTASTDYRRLVKIAGCTDDISNISTITVNPKPVFGSLNVDCTGANLNSVTVNATISSGTLEYNVDGGTYQSSNIFTGLSVGDHTFNIRETSSQCSVSSGSQTIECICPTVTSNTINASQTICEGETPTGLTGNLPIITPVTPFTYQWQSRPAGTGVWTNLTTTQNYSPGALTASTDYRRLVKIAGCTDDISNISTITVNPKPVFGSLNVDCTGANLNSVTVNATISSGTLEYNVDGGTYQSSNIFTGLSVGDHTFNIRETSSQCSVSSGSQTIECICPTVTSNTINASQTICEGETPTGLTGNLPIITPVTPFTYQWQSRPAGTGVWTNLTTTQNYSPGALTASTDYRRLVKIAGCTDDISNTSTITVNPKPVLTFNNTSCAPDLLTYTINFTSNGFVTSTAGTVNNSENTVTDIPKGTSVTLTATRNSCSTQLGVTAPGCTCPTVNRPTSPNNVAICQGETNIPISASVNSGETIDWYNSPSGKSLLEPGSLSYTSTNTDPGTYTYYAETRNTTHDCTSDSRLPVTFTIKANPILTVTSTTCSPDLLTYSIVFVSNGTVTVPDISVNNDEQTIIGIPAGTDVTLTATSNGCTTILNVTAPGCTCPTVNPPTSPNNVSICQGETNTPISASVNSGETIDWYESASGENLLKPGSLSYTSTEVNPGTYTYYAETRNTTHDCTSDSRLPVTFTIKANPTLTLDGTECAPNLLTYTINFTSNGFVTSTAGTVNNSENTVTDIPKGTSVTLTATRNSCSTQLGVTAPGCTCPTVNPPASPNNVAICQGETNTPISASVNSGETIDWYSSASGGTLLEEGTLIYTSTEVNPGTYTYYAETRNTTNNCTSDSRLPVTFTIKAKPTLTLVGKECAPDLRTYTINFTSNGNVTASAGLVNNDDKTVSEITAGTDITLTASSNGCITILNVTSPDCSCPDLPVPTNGIGSEVCFGDDNNAISATVGEGETIDWYSSATGELALVEGSTTFTSTQTNIGIYTYYAEARNTTHDCTSDSRLPVTFTIKANPTLSLSSTTCSPDLLTYAILFVSNGTVTTSAGTVSENTVTGIPKGTNVTLTATFNGCTTELNVPAPGCTCPIITPPTSPNNVAICQGETNTPISASVGEGETIDWYSSASGGTLLEEETLTYFSTEANPGTYTYYAETRNTTNNCTSDSRLPVTFTIKAKPTLTLVGKECAPNLRTYTINFTSNGNVTASAGLVNNDDKTVSEITAGTDITLTASSNGCITILNVTSPDCSCPDLPVPTNGIGSEVCFGDDNNAISATVGEGETIDWYSSATGELALVEGSTTFTSTQTNIGIYTYYAEARNTTSECTSSGRLAVSYQIKANPTLSLISATCSPDLTTYNISFSSNRTITSTLGSVDNNTKTVTGIPAGTNVTLTATFNGCTTILDVNAPDCSCPSINTPTEGVGNKICFGEDNTSISASVGTGETIDWYSSPSGGTPLLKGNTTFTSTETAAANYTYYAEARNISSNCTSSSRLPVNYQIKANPTLSLISASCAADLTTYGIVFVSNGTVTSTAGSVDNDAKIVTGIPAETNVTLTATFNGCTTILNVNAPDCSCPTVNAPTEGIGNQICFGNENTPISASVGKGETIDWYSSPLGGVLLLTGSTTFTSSETDTAKYTYYAESRNTTTNCISSSRLGVSFEIRANPILSLISASCAADLTTFDILFVSNGTVTSTEGSVDNDAKTVTGIPAGANVTLTATFNGCTTILNVNAPDCSCPPVNTPTEGIGNQVCFGNENTAISASVGEGETIDWYSSPLGGVPLLTGSTTFTSSETDTAKYTYYAEARNTSSGCTSSSRLPVSYQIKANPTLLLISTSCAADLTTYDIVFASNGAIASTEGSVDNDAKTVTGIPAGTNVTLTATFNACTTVLDINAPDCSCPPVNTPTEGIGNQVCFGNENSPISASVGEGETIDWYDSPLGGVSLLTGSTTFTSSETDTAKYTYYAEARNTTTNCISSSRLGVSFEIRANPILSLISASCTADLTTYDVLFASNGTVTSTDGSVDNNAKTVTGIPAGTNVTLTATLNGCTTILDVNAPDCSCPTVNTPTEGIGNQVCFGNENTPISASIGEGETIDWYSSPLGGVPLLTGSTTFTSLETDTAKYTYYAEARNISSGCTSSSRLPVSYQIKANPTLLLISASCSADLTTYDIVFVSNGAITSTEGSVDNDAKTVIGISAGTNVTLTATFNGCTTILDVNAPDCSCPTVNTPTDGIGNQICFGNENTSISASVGEGETVDWYSSPLGGVPLLTGSTTFTSLETDTAKYTYYAEARNVSSGCTSSSRLPISYQIKGNPTLLLISASCTADLATYNIVFISNGTVTSTEGSVDNDTKTVTGIPAGTNVTITATFNGCTTMLDVNAPDCNCPSVNTPTDGIGNQICFGNENTPISASVGEGETIDWYSSPLGGVPLLTGSTTFTSTETDTAKYTYYAEARNVSSGCTSSSRLAINYDINPNPVFISIDLDCMGNMNSVTVNASISSGILEFQIDSSPFQSSNIFTNVPNGNHTFSIRESTSLCSISTEELLINCVNSTADLSLDMFVNNPNPIIGTNVVFTLIVTNSGPSNTTAVTVTDLLPSGYSFISSDGEYTSSSGIWNIGALDNGATATLNITATVNPSGVYNNYAQITTSDMEDPDSTPGNDSTIEDDDDTITTSGLVAEDDTFDLIFGCENTSVSGNVMANDLFIIDDNIIASLITDPTSGSLIFSEDGTFTFNNNEEFSGTILFSYQICKTENNEVCDTATVTINVKTDTDCDGIANEDDTDDDNDWILDVFEGDGNIDSDNDGIPNSLDIDSDNDGITDFVELQPEGSSLTLAELSLMANDPESYNLASVADIYEEPVDTDADGIPDYIDLDSDNDGVPDSNEGHDANSDLIPDVTILDIDSDVDGLDDAYDIVNGWSNFDNPNGSNAPLQDYDYDNIRDWRDLDDDNDGRPTTSLLNKISNNCEIFIPEIFSPNGDGIQDYFRITCIYYYPEAKIQIYNRWGNIVYKKDNYGNVRVWGETEAWWDGSSNNGLSIGSKKLPPATYFYILDLNDGSELLKGYLYLNR